MAYFDSMVIILRQTSPELREPRSASFACQVGVLGAAVRPPPCSSFEPKSTDNIEAAGGRGDQEFRSWLAMLGAAQAERVCTVFYEPVRYLVTGMGAIVARGTQSRAKAGAA